MTPRRARIAARAILAVSLALAAATVIIWSFTRQPSGGDGIFLAFVLILGLTFCATGSLLVARVPGNPVGWLLYTIGLFQLLNGLTTAYATATLSTNPGSLPFRGIAGWAGQWSWMPSVGLLATFLLLLFPDGHPPSRRWRWVGWLAAFAMALLIGGAMVEAWPLRTNIKAIENSNLDSPAVVIGFLLLGIAMLASIASLVVRFRRSSGDERQQLRWFTFAALFMVVGLILDFTSIPAVELLFVVGFFAIPITTALSILKYRLYDLDLVLKKTVVISLLALFILGLYFAVIAFAAVSGLGAAIAAIILAITFQPVRAGARKVADRLVYGKRATPYEVLTEFSEQLSGEVATEDVAPRMAELLATATGAQTARVWLRIGGELRPQASWPTDAGAVPSLPLSDGAIPAFSADATAVEVTDGGELLGALSVEMPANDPINPERERLVRDLASQAGLVLRNVRLIEELRASRQRLVAAQDEERRKIERNLHDGAQQQLIALAIKVNLAESLADKSPDKTKEMLTSVKRELQESVETLRDLARGIYPPLLADQGLAVALDAQAKKAAIPTTVVPNGLGRYPQEIEAAVYFCSLEALQNVAKYAQATNAEIHLRADGSSLEFEITDDGTGFDPSSTTYGTGLQGMADRLDAIGGTLEIRSERGKGTTVTGRLPAQPAAGAPEAASQASDS